MTAKSLCEKSPVDFCECAATSAVVVVVEPKRTLFIALKMRFCTFLTTTRYAAKSAQRTRKPQYTTVPTGPKSRPVYGTWLSVTYGVALLYTTGCEHAE